MIQETPAGRPPVAHLLAGLLASLYAWVVVVTTFSHPGTIGLNYNAPGTDYMVFHAAVFLALRGDLATLYDAGGFTALLNHMFSAYLTSNLEFRPWIYPPSFLPLLLPFSSLSFPLSYWAFQLFTALAMIAGLKPAIGSHANWIWLGVLLCPAASICFVSGQCSFLIVALLTAGVILLDRRPVLSGVMFGLLCFKPQFFLLIPVLLAARMSWRTIASTTITCLVMAVATILCFGPAIWTGWLDAISSSTSGSDPRWFLLGRLWGVSVYACAYLLGAMPAVASLAQIGAAVLSGCSVWLAFRQPMPKQSRSAVILAAALLAAPHSGGYDLLLLVAACGLFLSCPELRAGKIDWLLGLVIWLAPLLGLPVMSIVGRFIPVLTIALLIRIFGHARTLRRRWAIALPSDAEVGVTQADNI